MATDELVHLILRLNIRYVRYMNKLSKIGWELCITGVILKPSKRKWIILLRGTWLARGQQIRIFLLCERARVCSFLCSSVGQKDSTGWFYDARRQRCHTCNCGRVKLRPRFVSHRLNRRRGHLSFYKILMFPKCHRFLFPFVPGFRRNIFWEIDVILK